MKFRYAAKGVKKIFIAEIIELIACFFLIAASILPFIHALNGKSFNDLSDLNEANKIMVVVGALVGSGMIFVAYIINLIGIINAGKDEGFFKTALAFVILAAASNIIAACFESGSDWNTICSGIAKAADLGVTICVIEGIVSLSKKLGNTELAARGKTIEKIIVVIYVLAIAGVISVTFIGTNEATAVIGLILLAGSFILSVVQYILYIGYLSKAKNMLAA